MAREDDINITMPIEINVEKGKKQSDVLFDYIEGLYKKLQSQFKSAGIIDPKQLKEIVKIGKSFYKIQFLQSKSGVVPEGDTVYAMMERDASRIKISAEEASKIYKQASKTLDKATRDRIHKEARGNESLEKLLIRREKLILRQKAEGSTETKYYKNLETRVRNLDKQISEETKANRELFKKEKAQEALNQKLKEYKALIQETSFTSAKDVSRMQSKLLSEQTVAGARGLDASGFDAPIADLQKKKDLYAQIGAELRALMGEQLSKRDQLKLELEGTRERLSALKEQFVQLRASGGDVKALSKEISDTAKEAKKLEKAIKPSWFEKLVNTFKRIGFYRLARDFFRLTINAFKEGIQGLAQFDDVANETMSELNSSITVIKMSMAQMLLSIVQMFVPAVKDIATAFAEVANNIGQAVARMRGLSTYTKINTEYMKKYGEEANSALSFDKFEALSGGNDQYEGLFIKDAQVEQNNEAIDSWVAGLKTIKTVLSSVWEIVKTVIKALKNVWDNAIAPNLDTILYAIEFVIDAIGKIIVGLSKFLVWLTKNKEVALGIAGVIGVILTSVGTALMSPRMIASGVALTTLSVAGFVSTAVGNSTVNTSGNANLTTGLNGSSMKDAMVDALYEASSGGMFNSESGDFVIKLDGAEIARSKRFKAELNRTNSNLNLK